MYRLIAIFLLFAWLTPTLQAQKKEPSDPQRPAAATPSRPAAATNDQLLQALFISEFQRQVGVSDEQFTERFRPILTQWLQQRRNVATRRNAAVASLRQLMTSKASDQEITRQIADVDTAENQTRNAERRLSAQLDPLLTPAQQAKFRLFQIDIEQRIRELLAEAARPAANPQAPPRGGSAR